MNTKRSLAAALLAASLAVCVTAPAADAPKSEPPVDVENTGRNERDRGSKDAVTPIDQSNRAEDLKVTQEIRRAVMSDNTLSLNAKNAKIITTEDKVVLRGPVDSEVEKKAIGLYARTNAGSRELVNELDVKVQPKS